MVVLQVMLGWFALSVVLALVLGAFVAAGQSTREPRAQVSPTVTESAAPATPREHAPSGQPLARRTATSPPRAA